MRFMKPYTLDKTNSVKDSKGTRDKGHRRSLWLWLIGIWVFLVAGLPLYYLQSDRDWYYSEWGEPLEILESRKISENPLYQDEGVYTRVFVARASEENVACFNSLAFAGSCLYPERIDPLLKEYSLPAPYRFGNTGCVDFALCSNGLMLVYDFSRNKGGLLSSRLLQTGEVERSYPLGFVNFYIWAHLSLVVLVLTLVLLFLAPILFLLLKVASRCIRAFLPSQQKPNSASKQTKLH